MLHRTNPYLSLGDTTCKLTKKTCTYCDLAPQATCAASATSPYTQTDCYNGVDGITYVMSEYKVDTAWCYLASCFYTDISYTTLDIVITMMSCSTGTYY